MQGKKGYRLVLGIAAVLAALLLLPFAGAGRTLASAEAGVFTGVDVSSYNGTMDWPKAMSVGVEFAIIRIGFGDDYPSQDDSQAIRNMQECEKYGIPYGVYIYSYALSEREVDSEIAHTLRVIKGHNPKLGVWFDMEDADYYKERNGFSPYAHGAQLTEFCLRYMRGIRAAGYPVVGVYANTDYFNNVLDYNRIKAEGLIWLAHWRTATPGWPYDMWQYTEQGMRAINGNNFDTNRIDAGSPLFNIIAGFSSKPKSFVRPADALLALGDLTGDGVISLPDLSKVKQYVMGQLLISRTAFYCADLNSDGKVSLADLTILKKHIVGTDEIRSAAVSKPNAQLAEESASEAKTEELKEAPKAAEDNPKAEEEEQSAAGEESKSSAKEDIKGTKAESSVTEEETTVAEEETTGTNEEAPASETEDADSEEEQNKAPEEASEDEERIQN